MAQIVAPISFGAIAFLLVWFRTADADDGLRTSWAVSRRPIAARISACPKSAVRRRYPRHLRRVSLGVLALQLEAQAGPRRVGRELPVLGLDHAVEEQSLDSGVVVKVLEVHRL